MLSIRDVHFSYRGKAILTGLSLDVQDGEHVGLVGPNGAGKSTLIKIISGVLRPASGSVHINGADITAMRPHERARLVAVVPQETHLPAGMTVLDLVLLGRNPHMKLLQWEGPDDRAVAIRAMELTNIDQMADRYLSTLSGGERQRAVVAMALAQESPVLLMDEPTSSLDLAHQAKVLDMVAELHQKRRGAVLIAMHDLTLAAQYCHRLVMLSEGRTYAQGQPSEVLTVENISKVYGASVFVLPHPTGGTPVVVGRRE
ncbi:MAG: ABC transporter ATP-binding protein [SAR202 cluster bacterium]|nr:ABC transporter ATP-binding protein [SAR202 cluster bacterium]